MFLSLFEVICAESFTSLASSNVQPLKGGRCGVPVHFDFLGRFAAAAGGTCAGTSGSSLDHHK
jgi:hypothetical protein